MFSISPSLIFWTGPKAPNLAVKKLPSVAKRKYLCRTKSNRWKNFENSAAVTSNLEEIETEKENGKFVGEIDRHDPNVNIRGQIYAKSWQMIKNNPLLGIGWGAIGKSLGRDPRGVDLNSSNVFLEIYLGSGLIGFLCLVAFLGYILFSAIRRFFLAYNYFEKAFGLFIILSGLAFLIPNMFNAGIMLGFFWVWLAVAQAKNQNVKDKVKMQKLEILIIQN